MSAPPCCYHPTISASDDYSGVTCCLCDSPEHPCPAVTLQQRHAHEVYIGALEDGAA